ncbi:MAG: tRNA preQ1(34) S-adenosylmethionine ribosyltransferase-isomerase QueA [Alphaproteobacteria bacterium]
MDVNFFDFELPPERIAMRPVIPRDAARLLVVRNGEFEDRGVRDLPELLRAEDILVFNDTKVIPAQLTGIRAPRAETPGEGQGEGVRIEATLHRRTGPERWLAFARPAKRLRPGDCIGFGGTLEARVAEKAGEGEILLVFNQAGAALDAAIAEAGAMPLPPYIARRRPADRRDHDDYQTVYAAREGAVAAPTAGLHFTDELLAALAGRGVQRATVTLHVGAGTFLPVKAADTAGHKMHAEWGEIGTETAERINAARAAGGRVVAVGTTSLRLLESAAEAGGRIRPFTGETDIFITPGYRFRAVDLLMTNFHLPRSTLFMLVCAFCGIETMKRAYAHAVEAGYRFYSYGDSSLLFREEGA